MHYHIPNMRRLGVHTSIAGGMHMGLRRAHELGCTTVQLFSHNPRSWSLAGLDGYERMLFAMERDALGIGPVYIHCSYLINMASASPEVWEKSAWLLREEMKRADFIGADFLVLHTGSARDGLGLKRAVRGIHQALGGGGFRAGLLIENTSGKRGDIASTLREMAAIKDATGGLVSGACIDTCHAFAAGYDFRDADVLDAFAMEADALLGARSVKLIHLNDSKGEAGSGTDRHEHIGLGKIGSLALARFVNHGGFRDIPLVLETPKTSEEDDAENLRRARELLKDR